VVLDVLSCDAAVVWKNVGQNLILSFRGLSYLIILFDERVSDWQYDHLVGLFLCSGVASIYTLGSEGKLYGDDIWYSRT
jgi:hypothetical protein